MHRITLIPGDGIGPEVVAATQKVLESAGVGIEWEVHHAGVEVAKLTGTPLPPSVVESVRKNKIALKGPVTTPIGQGFRSVNVTLRQTLDLYANVRPIRSLPNVESRFDVDMVIVRENTEGLYAGLELMILPGVAQSIKLTTDKSSTRIARFSRFFAPAGKLASHGRSEPVVRRPSQAPLSRPRSGGYPISCSTARLRPPLFAA